MSPTKQKRLTALGLITRTDEEIGDVTTQHADFKTEFPSLVTGLGKVRTEVHRAKVFLFFVLYD